MVVHRTNVRSDTLTAMSKTSLVLLSAFLSSGASALTALCTCDYGHNIVNCSSLELAEFNQSELLCGHSFTKIDLSRNVFREFPQDLRHYKFVDISNNELKRIDAERKQKVEILDVSHNSVSVIDLGDAFPRLRNLYANVNNLGGLSDRFLQGQCHLEHLELSDNKIKSLNAVTVCTSVSVLAASGNLLSELPGNMTELKNLLMLYIPHNQIKHVSGLPETLEILDLSYNEITIINPSTLMNLASLRVLDLSHNAISDLEMRSFTSLKALEILNLSVNDLIVLMDGVFQGMKSLKIMDISANQITSVSNGAFSGLPALESLNISVNLLTTAPALRLGNKVQEVSFFFNHIRKVNALSILAMFAGTENSRFVDLGGNPFSGDDPGWIKLVSKFDWVCEDKWKTKVESFSGDERPSVRFKFHKLAHTPCPCAIFTKRLWRFAACVKDEGEINGTHWLEEATKIALLDEHISNNYTHPTVIFHEEM